MTVSKNRDNVYSWFTKIRDETRKGGFNVSKLRCRNGALQGVSGTLATAIGVRPYTMSLKLKGKAPITLDEATKIRDTINKELSLEYLFETEAVDE